MQIPPILGWSVDDLADRLPPSTTPPGSVVLVDHAGLVGDPEVVLVELAALADRRQWKVIVGLMAPRSLRQLESGLQGRQALRAVTEAMPGIATQAITLVVLSGPTGSTATVSQGRPLDE